MRRILITIIAVIIASLPAARAPAQTLETETARLLHRGWWKAGGAFETQTSSDGREVALPLLVEYGVTDRLELLVEPVPYTAIRPSVGRDATGAGDIELTGTALVHNEGRHTPAIAVAEEVKFPTAHDNLIGTGETDYTTYIIASKRFGRFDTHANLAYAILGSPPGSKLQNTWNGAFATVFRPTTRAEVFAEVLGNTAASPEGEGEGMPGETTPVPEAAGAELVGSIGAGAYVTPAWLLYGGVSYDNNNATQLRIGVTIYARRR